MHCQARLPGWTGEGIFKQGDIFFERPCSSVGMRLVMRSAPVSIFKCSTAPEIRMCERASNAAQAKWDLVIHLCHCQAQRIHLCHCQCQRSAHVLANKLQSHVKRSSVSFFLGQGKFACCAIPVKITVYMLKSFLIMPLGRILRALVLRNQTCGNMRPSSRWEFNMTLTCT